MRTLELLELQHDLDGSPASSVVDINGVILSKTIRRPTQVTSAVGDVVGLACVADLEDEDITSAGLDLYISVTFDSGGLYISPQ